MNQARRTTATARLTLSGVVMSSLAAILILVGCSSSTHSNAQSSDTTGATTAAGKSGACPTGSAAGATSTQVTLGVTIIDITGGSLSNATVGLPSVQEQEGDWNLVAGNINAAGGAGCRKLALNFYQVNPIDAAAAQQTCLDIAAAHPYMVLDSGALTAVGASNCIPAHHIPLSSASLTQDQLTKYSPYYLQIGDIPEDGIHNGVLGLNQLGFFSSAKGFKKLGVVHHDCTPALYSAEQAALTVAGVPTSQIVTYSLGCPAGQSDTPAAMEQAVLNFKSAGVTDVTEVDLADFALFTQIAAQQNYRPRYLLTDSALSDASKSHSGSGALNPTNTDGAVDVEISAYGEATTPGFQSNIGTQKCDAIFTGAGKQTVYQQTDGYGGVVCDYLTYAQALLNHTRTIQASSLLSALHSLGTVQLSYPGEPIDFSAAPAGSAFGVAYWRAAYFHASCACFQIPDPTFHPPFR